MYFFTAPPSTPTEPPCEELPPQEQTPQRGLLGLLSAELGVRVGNLDRQLLSPLDNSLPLAGRHVVRDLCEIAVWKSAHAQKSENAHVLVQACNEGEKMKGMWREGEQRERLRAGVPTRWHVCC